MDRGEGDGGFDGLLEGGWLAAQGLRISFSGAVIGCNKQMGCSRRSRKGVLM